MVTLKQEFFDLLKEDETLRLWYKIGFKQNSKEIEGVEFVKETLINRVNFNSDNINKVNEQYNLVEAYYKSLFQQEEGEKN